MKSTSHREFSIWNMLRYGTARLPNMNNGDSQPLINSTDIEVSGAIPSYRGEYEDEKRVDSIERNTFYISASRSNNGRRKLSLLLVSVFSIFYFLYHWRSYGLLKLNFQKGNGTNLAGIHWKKVAYDPVLPIEEFEGPPKEIIQVSNPYIPKPSYGAPVYSSLLLNHTFGSSWGHPRAVDFVPPDVEFNKVILTLKTSVNGVQYDRLSNLFVNGVEVWRTSTIEPGNRSVFSQHKKDVSQYLKLFQNSAKILLQLDNLINDRLTGQFQVELYIDLYQSNDNVFELDENLSGKHNIFSTNKPADQIYSLIENKDENTPPLTYLPSDRLVFQIPNLSQNTTRLKLSVFTSGNAAEEFWYSNVLDKYTHSFDRHFPGHGPLRIVNVYFNGEKIAAQTPEPIIFTGGLSPALWSAVVSMDAFDLPSLDFDISGLLPFLWDGQEIEDKVLEIEISNEIDEKHSFKSSVGENWISTANLLTFESSDVVGASGEVITMDDKNDLSIIDFSPPFSGKIQQILASDFKTSLISNLNFELKDGYTLRTIVTSLTRTTISNVQSYKQYGSNQALVHSGKTKKSFSIENAEGGKDDFIHKFDTTLDYPLVLTLKEKNQTIGAGSYDIEYDIEIVNAKNAKVTIDDYISMESQSVQNGTSTYFISKSGNHGNAKIDTKYKLKVDSPEKSYIYRRKVKTANGTITNDTDSVNHKEELTTKSNSFLSLNEYIKARVSKVFRMADFPQSFGSLTQKILNDDTLNIFI